MIDTVIFDLGKVLVKFDSYQGMLDIGFSEEEAKVFYEKIFSGPWLECDRMNHTLESIKKYFLSFVPGYEKQVDMLFDNLTRLTGSMPYARPLLEKLKARGLNLYILSNYGNVSFEINKAVYDFLDLFDGGVISYEIEEVKPSPIIYNYLLNKYNIIPQNAIFLDDRLENVIAAEQLGIHGIHFDSYENASKKLFSLLDNEE